MEQILSTCKFCWHFYLNYIYIYILNGKLVCTEGGSGFISSILPFCQFTINILSSCCSLVLVWWCRTLRRSRSTGWSPSCHTPPPPPPSGSVPGCTPARTVSGNLSQTSPQTIKAHCEALSMILTLPRMSSFCEVLQTVGWTMVQTSSMGCEAGGEEKSQI